MAKTKRVSRKDTRVSGSPRLRMDGWSNLVTGLGNLATDKLSYSDFDFNPIEMTDAEILYAIDDNAAKIVDELPNESFREGFEIISKDQDLAKAIKEYIEKLHMPHKHHEAWSMARLYGGSGLLILTNDMQNADKPLRSDSIDEIRGFTPLSRYELIAQRVDCDLSSKNFGFPTIYSVCPRGMSTAGDLTQMMSVHYTRIIRFEGSFLPRQLFIARKYWGDSVLTRPFEAIRNYSVSHQAASIILQDFSVATYKLSGLVEALASGDDQALMKRLQAVAMSRSVARAVAVDAEAESFEYQSRSVSGLPEILKAISGRMVAAADRIPHTRLLGESPEGSNSTGNSTTMGWYDYVANQQEAYLKPRLMLALKLICLSKRGPTNGQIPEGLDIVFKPLWQMDEVEGSQVRNTQAQSDAVYIDRGVVDPDEVRESRFGQGKYSVDTKLSKKAPSPRKPPAPPVKPSDNQKDGNKK